MLAQLERRRERLAGGAGSLGWKVGFGAPAAMEKLGLDAPLTGFLSETARIEPGATVSLAGWTNPLLEPEIALHLRADVGAGTEAGEAWQAVAGIGAAFELADLDPPAEDVEVILAGNIFQRGVVLGTPHLTVPVAGLSATLVADGRESSIPDPQADTGPVARILAHVADRLGAFGERLRAGEVVICGSIVPPIPVAAGQEYGYRLDSCDEITIRFGV
jgi:2-keto-4-pentenoate hydratase